MKKTFILLFLGAAMCVTLTAQELLKGNASYYSDKLHGRRMSNGEKYHRDSMTCAHLKFPFGTLLKVRNPLNGKEVIVKVTDRGPHTRRFIIDLSRAAAAKLDIIRAGFSQVEITPYHKNQVPYKPEVEEEELPELNLQYSTAATYPDPAWKRDSTSTAPVDGVEEKEVPNREEAKEEAEGREPAEAADSTESATPQPADS